MYTYDEILASGYYVFRDQLTTIVVISIIATLKKMEIELPDLKIKELDRIIELDGYIFRLNKNYCLDDIKEFIDENLVLLFEDLKKSRNEYYENKTSSKVLRKEL